VTVGASHLAALNFGEDRSPAIGTLHQPADFRPLALGIQVVEFENNGISVAAVNASMLSEVLRDSRPQCSPPRGCITNVPSDVRLTIARIVRAAVLSDARLALLMVTLGRFVPKSELFDLFGLATNATGAPAHRETV
jgi:hypothetical protein